MSETAHSFSHLDEPVPGTVRAPGWHVLRGWVWPKPGRHFVDVRARVDGRVFAAIHGHPRADLAVHFKTGKRYALAGFTVTVELHPGPAEIILEVLELEGRWIPFETVAYLVEDPTAPPFPPSPPRPLKWHDFTRGLDFLLRSRRTRPEVSWVRLATELAAELPVMQDQLFPPQPFIGHADEPAAVNRCRFGLLPVVGYLFHQTEPIQRLWVTADLQALQPLRLGRATANLIPHFPQYPVAGTSGYEGYVDVPTQLPNPVVLRLYAEMAGGVLHLVQVRTTRRHDAELEKYPYAGATAATFDEALTAWRSALRIRGFTVTVDDQLHAAIAQLRTGYVPSAPQVPPTVAGRANPPDEPRLVRDDSPHPTPPPATAPAFPRRIVLASHNLNLEGAPLFLLDLAQHYAALGAALTVVSPADGVLRPRFEVLGAKIALVDAAPVFAAQDEAAARAALDAVGRAFDFSAADLVVTNTFTAFWAVHAAKTAGRRVLSYVHESTSPAAFYGGSVSPAVLALADTALELADAVSFTSEATRRYHAWPGRPIRAVVTPGWVDLRWIDGWLAAHPRAALREKFGMKPGEWLVTNVGTVCDRKGQLGFARAVDLFNRRRPDLAARTRFVLLGGRDAPFDHFLRDILADLALPNLVVHPETPDFLGYYAAADLTVCSSHEESSPRVVFEAMACGTPLLASAIPGISELARHNQEAALVAAGDTPAWADALASLLDAPATGQSLAAAARTRTEQWFAASSVLPAHLALARAVAAGQPAP